MDIKNWKSVAVRKSSYDKLLALCDKEYRNPAAFIALLVDKEIERRANLKKMSPEAYLEKIFKEHKNGQKSK
jgi:hypothetical protein